MHNNPYSKAAGAYGAPALSTDQRALEGSVLLKSASNLEALARRIEAGEKPSLEEIDDTLTNNRKIWQIFLDNAMNEDNGMPLELRNNVASLAVFVFKRTQDILIDTRPEKFTVLVNINRNIASGLMKRPVVPAAAPNAALPEKPAATMAVTDSMA